MDTGKCLTNKPEKNGGFDKGYLENGEYKCTDSLLDITRGTARCIPTGSCTGYLYRTNVCVTRLQCAQLI